MTQCKLDGKTYEIPDIWLAGFTSHNHCEILDAVRQWAWQSELAERESEQAS